MLLSLLCATTLQSTPITYTCKATSLAAVVSALSAQSSQPMRVSGPIGNLVLIASFKDQPLKSVMEKIAQVAAGRWVTENGVSVLSADSSALNVRSQAEIARRSLVVKREQGRLAAGINSKPVDFGRNIQELMSVYRQLEQLQEAADEKLYQRLEALTQQLPSGTLINRIVTSFDPNVLAGLPLNQRVVFAMTPTKMQRSLPSSAQAAARDFARNQAQVNQAWNQLPKEDREQAAAIYMSGNSEGTPTEVLVTATRYQDDNIGVDLTVLDEKGRVITQTSIGIGSGGDFQEKIAEGDVKSTKEAPKEKPDDSLIKIEDESKTVLALLRPDTAGIVPWLKCPKALQEKLQKPEEIDPLSFATSDLILGYAQAKGKPFLAVIPDRGMLLGSYMGSATVSTVQEALKQYGILDLSEKDDWLTGVSPTFTDDQAGAANRPALGALIRTIAKANFANLDMLANYARNSSVNQPYDGIYYLMIQNLFGPWLTGLNPSDLTGLRFYGSLSANVRENLKKGMAFSAIGGEAQQNLALYIYRQGQVSGAIFDEPSAAQAEVDVATASFELHTDPTEVLPLGIPANTLIKLSALTDDVVIPQGGASTPLAAGDLASQVAMEERPDLFPWANENRLPSKFKMSKRQNYTFLFHFTQSLGSVLSLIDVSQGDGPVITKNELPTDFKRTFDDQLKMMRDMYKDMKPGQGNRGGQPPPK
ncbi:MAG: hypothetical protein ABL949_04775 [Fimbriimonadaceae bacterium]